MNTPSFARRVEEDARLVILQELHRQPQGRASDAILTLALEAAGHGRSRDWTRTQLRKVDELGGLDLTEAGTALIAQITRAGVDHVLRRGRIEGIMQPELGV